MSVCNDDIARVFDEMADLLDIEGVNPYRVRAYRNAALIIRGLSRQLSEYLAAGEDLTDLPAIGKDLAAKIKEIIATGKIMALDKLQHVVPASLEELLQIPGLGPKRVHKLYYELGIATLQQLEQAAQAGRLRQLAGFGNKTEQQILTAVTGHRYKQHH